MAAALRSTAAATLILEGLLVSWIAAINSLTARLTGSIESVWQAIWFVAYLAGSVAFVVLLWSGARAMWRARSSGPTSSRDRSIIRIVGVVNVGIGMVAGLVLAGAAIVNTLFAMIWLVAGLFTGVVAVATAREAGPRGSGKASHGSTPMARDR